MCISKKPKKWCGKRRAFGDGPLCFCTKKCRDTYQKKNPPKTMSLLDVALRERVSLGLRR